jgi:hypothetical protein
VRLASDNSHVTRGRSDQLSAGALVISQSLLPNTEYETRGQYIPSAPRDMLWSDWLSVTTPNVTLSYSDLDAAIVNAVNEVNAVGNTELRTLLDTIAAYVAGQDARNWTDKKQIRSSITARSDAASAEISEVRTVAVDTQVALANYQVTVSATFGSINSTITTQSTAIATLNGYAAASYGVTLDVNGYAIGFGLINGGGGVSSATFTVDKFKIAFPGVTGGAAVDVWTVANVNGSPKAALRGDMIVDGSITTQKVAAGAITTVTLDAQAVTSAKIQAGAITSASGVIGALGVQSLSIGDNAVTVPQSQTRTSLLGPGSHTNACDFVLSFDTTGLAGKTMYLYASFFGQVVYGGTTGVNQTGYLFIAGALASAMAGIDRTGICNMAAGYPFVATGGAQSIAVSVDWNGGGGCNMNSRTLFAIVTIR